MKTIKEFNLSEKIGTWYLDIADLEVPVVQVSDIKEFIRLLKDELSPTDLTDNFYQVCKVIDKLAGNKFR